MSATERLLARREDLKRDEASQVSVRDLIGTRWGFLVALFACVLLGLTATLGWF